MIQHTRAFGRTARRLATLPVALVVTPTTTAAAHTGGSYGGGMMGGWGLFGGTMGLLWMGLLLVLPAVVLYGLLTRRGGRRDDRPLAVLRERYARGELTDDEFEARRATLDGPDASQPRN
jgi:putative membrane protein